MEAEAFYYVSELEAIIREWVGIYHHSPHDGLCDPHLPHVELSPAEMFARGIAASGVLRLPASQDLRMEFLDVAWCTIQHYGVEIDGRRYDGPGLNLYRGVKSDYGGAHAGRWPIMVDHDDVRTVYFRDPVDGIWHELTWELRSPGSLSTVSWMMVPSMIGGTHHGRPRRRDVTRLHANTARPALPNQAIRHCRQAIFYRRRQVCWF